ncbi:MAG: amino acid ABC transporter ATP-binding protein [Deltaproteobacteria bacterium]|nr:amino acid ABC transporter ATP-binding protein [Deltaproteobacteria bacterium]
MIKIENLPKVFGSNLHVLQGINLEVKKGEVIVILGPSGSGKSTLLRCINFLEEPTAGTIEVNGVKIKAGEEVPPEELFTNPREDRSKQFLVHILD